MNRLPRQSEVFFNNFFWCFSKARNSPGTRSEPLSDEPSSSGNSNEDATRLVQPDESTFSNDLSQQDSNLQNPLVMSWSVVFLRLMSRWEDGISTTTNQATLLVALIMQSSSQNGMGIHWSNFSTIEENHLYNLFNTPNR